MMNKIESNLWIHQTRNDFDCGTLEDTEISSENSIEIKLIKLDEKFYSQGKYISDVIYTEPFHHLILSWNAEAPEETSIKIEAQVLVSKIGVQAWSNWLSFGTWSMRKDRTSEARKDAEDDLAYVDTDTLVVKCSEGETATAMRYRLTLMTENNEVSPSVKLVAGTIRNIDTSIAASKSGLAVLDNLDAVLDVPRLSQMIRDPKIAGSICSPTSVSMVLNYYGHNLVPEETAWAVYDTAYGSFGNWPFNTAYAGSFNFKSYVAYCNSVDDLKREILNSHPVVVSVKYRNSEEVDAKHPVIHGAPISKTNGHLIVVCGFIARGGKEYVVVNDPAAASNEAVRLEYLLEEFDAAWQKSGRVAYIIHPGE